MSRHIHSPWLERDMVLEVKTAIGHPVGATLSKKINKKTASGAASFSALSEGDTATESVPFLQSGQNLSTVTIDHLLMLSETAQNPDLEQKVLQHSHNVLDLLETFLANIICGAVSQKTLEDIQKLLDETSIATLDPKLRSIVEDIHIRAKVELAKIEIQSKI